MTWKDTINTRALNHNTGTIHLSNLCTEITLPQDRENVAVCNLASINLSRHVTGRRQQARVDWERLAESTRLAVRQLDNLIDITISSVPESERSNELNRALGLGVMGFTDIVERFGYWYQSKESYELIDEIMEFVSWHAIDASADLARERGAYPNFEGSRWSQGLVPIDSLDLLEDDRGVPVEVDRTARLDWKSLRGKVSAGIRNSTLMAIAPTASIGLVAGTTPGLDPQFSQIFSRATSSASSSRSIATWSRTCGVWVCGSRCAKTCCAIRVTCRRSTASPTRLQQIYRTSFQLSPYAFLQVAARAQKWIDQAISRNIYLQSRDVGEMVELYAAAWRMGVKTTYYLHMMPRHTAEQSTVKVNKAEQVAPAGGAPRRGFGAAAPKAAAPARGFGAVAAAVAEAEPVVPADVDELEQVDVVDGAACPIDPQERLQCDSCQ
ncbi:hypothetical protein [Aeromicrobium sp. UC242_57]|uniref:hypothetical protein n=1 Tax=Aeromicrobium sp. UC242_57 TaxID=3374624 RepID=UPI00379942DF